MTMRRPRTIPLLTAAIAVMVIGAASGCGNSAKLLPPDQASALDSALQQVSDATGAGDCQQAEQALRSAQRAYAALPASVDQRLMARLKDGLQQLTLTVGPQCRAVAAQAKPTTNPTTGTTTTSTPSTTTTTTTTSTPSTTTTTTTPTTTTTTTPPSTTSTGPNGGVTPGQTTTPGQTGATSP